LSDLLMLRNIILNKIGFGGREIGLWAAANGSFVHEEESRVKSASLILALDHRFSDHFVLGAAGGYNHTWSNGLSANAGWGGMYGLLFSGGWYLNQTVIGGGDSFDTTRVGLFGGVAQGSSKGWFFSSVTQGGYNFKRGAWKAGPYGVLQYALSGTDGWSEHGSAAPVTVHSSTSSSIVSDGGVETSYDLGKISFKVSAAWEHEYSDTTTFTSVNLVSVPSSVTTVAGTSLGHDSVVINSGVSYSLSRKILLSLGYTGQYGRKNYESNSVTGSIRISF